MTFQKLISKTKKITKYERILFFVLFVSFFLRFWQLGFSHFYGDETKTFYLDKTVSATKYLLDQRKGPVQFLAVWVMEKVVGGYDEFYTRLPFAWAGFLSVLVLYLLLDKIFNKRVALIGTTLFGLNGFYIAFSRTTQYQSFLVFFGLLSIYFGYLYYESSLKNKNQYLVLSAVMLAGAYLCHYDALFFDVAVGFILLKKIFEDKRSVIEILKYFLVPFLVVISIFYVPYYIYGYYVSNTANYVGRRLVGKDLLQNLSWYTFWIYNPQIIWAFLSVFIVPYFYKQSSWKRNFVLFWFLFSIIFFEFIFSNPGTHIHNYFLPFMILVSLGINDVYIFLKSNVYENVFLLFISLAFIFIL
ncbi:glycosyltransferase family 39 protein [Patescibacteria group bacterium]